MLADRSGQFEAAGRRSSATAPNRVKRDGERLRVQLRGTEQKTDDSKGKE